MRHQRVDGTLTPSERSRRRRGKQTSHQAGSPESGTSSECRSTVGASEARLGYALRTGSPVRSVRRLFYSLLNCVKPREPEPDVPDSSMYVPLGKGKRRRFIKFVKGPSLDEEKASYDPADVATSRPPEHHSLAPLLRATSTPWIGYDYRVTGTFLEAERLVELRRLREEAMVAGKRFVPLSPEKVEWFESDSSFMKWVGQTSATSVTAVCNLSRELPPLFRTRIGTYDLSRAIHHNRESRLSVSMMVYEHLLGLAEFLPSLEDGTEPEVYLAPQSKLLYGRLL